jgi:hypothetical protein
MKTNPKKRFRAIFVCLTGVSFVSGCTAYTQTEIDLTGQARRGLTLIRAAQADHVAVVGRLNTSQRQRLDDAFDDDVRETADLSPDWVIDHRKAYGTGIDALQLQKSASVQAAETASRNVDAIEAALTQLERLQRSRIKLESTFTNQPTSTNPEEK